jgi:hypothetical protein
MEQLRPFALLLLAATYCLGDAQATVVDVHAPVQVAQPLVLEKNLPEALDRRVPGFYLSPRNKPGRVTTGDPLADLEISDIVAFMKDHPELRDHRVVIALPSLLRGKEKLSEVKMALSDLGLPTDIEVIRWPNGTVLESVLDFFPRRQDWQSPIREEITTGHAMVFGGEALSMSLMLYLVLTKKLSPLLGLASSVLDLAHQAIITYPVRFLSNYQRRQTFARQFLFNVLYGAFEATSFFLLLNSQDLESAMPKFATTVASGALLSAIWSSTSVNAFRWEGSPNNRMPLENKRVFRSNILFFEQIILSPFFIYSLSPFPQALFEISAFGAPVMDVNIGHVVVLGAGLAAAASYPMVDRLASFTSSLAESPGLMGECVRLLSRERRGSER